MTRFALPPCSSDPGRPRHVALMSVLAHVFRPGDQFQIFERVVQRVSVLVVDDHSVGDRATRFDPHQLSAWTPLVRLRDLHKDAWTPCPLVSLDSRQANGRSPTTARLELGGRRVAAPLHPLTKSRRKHLCTVARKPNPEGVPTHLFAPGFPETLATAVPLAVHHRGVRVDVGPADLALNDYHVRIVASDGKRTTGKRILGLPFIGCEIDPEKHGWAVDRVRRAEAAGVQMLIPSRPKKAKQEVLFR